MSVLNCKAVAACGAIKKAAPGDTGTVHIHSQLWWVYPGQQLSNC